MKTINLINRGIKTLCLSACVLSLASCLDGGDETIALENANPLGIPSDNAATPNPSIDNSNTSLPNFQYTMEDQDGYTVMRLDMTGVMNSQTYEWLKLYGTNGSGAERQNVWVSIDDKPKGIIVSNNSDDEEEDKPMVADLVFLVDNSGSMSEEADVIARDVISWSNKLASSNIDIKFGCVGYDGSVNGALNMTDANSLSSYLNRYSGTDRTVGFAGEDASNLKSYSSAFTSYWSECGMMALHYANSYFKFRTGSNRIYVNFTDEPNQPSGVDKYSVEYLKSQTNWNTAQGTIHSVYSSDTTFTASKSYEKPWLMSRYTGGTELYAPYNFNGVSLESLPVTGAMQNSYVIRFTNIEEFMDGQPHRIKITILSADGSIKAEKTYTVIFAAS